MNKENTGKNMSGMNRRGFIKNCLGGACALAGTGSLTSLASAQAQTTPSAEVGERAQKGLLGFRRSQWFRGLENQNLLCTLCPRACRIPAGRRGFCRVRGNWEGEGYTLVFGNPSMVQIDPIERKPFYHVLPATESLSVSTAGCNVTCKFCEVWDMALVAPDDVYAYDLSPEQVIEHAGKSGVHSVSFTFGEPVVFWEYMYEIAQRTEENGLLSLMHSNAYIEPEPLDSLCEVIDGANIDLKGFDPQFYRDIVGGELQPVLKNLKSMRENGIHLEITNLIIPTLNEDVEKIKEMCKWIRDELGPDTPLHFNRFYPLYKLSNLPPTPVSKLNDARSAALDVGLEYVYIGNVTGHEGQHTYCPGCKEEIIHRVGFMVDKVNIENGSCGNCGHTIPGIW